MRETISKQKPKRRKITMVRKIVVALFLCSIIGGSTWFYYTHIYSIPIKKLVDNPRDYEGKSLVISGKVVDRLSLLFLKYFKLKDKSGEIIVITPRMLPALGSTVRVKGKVVEAFAIGTEQLLVFVEDGFLQPSPNTRAAVRHILAFAGKLL
jgi:hypothetical protein